MTPEEIEWLEKYISSLPWSTEATDKDKTLVAGNLRAFYRAVMAIVCKEMEKYQEEIESLRHERDTLLDANNGFKAGLMRILGTEHEGYQEYLNEIADLKSERDEDEIVRCPNCGVML